MQNRARGHPWLSVPGDPDPDLIAEAKVAAGDDPRRRMLEWSGTGAMLAD